VFQAQRPLEDDGSGQITGQRLVFTSFALCLVTEKIDASLDKARTVVFPDRPTAIL
jgi:hypothetical protein